MAMRCFVCLLAALWAGSAAGEIIQLKDHASIQGRVVADRGDHVFVDLGYTFLSIPREAIVKIVQDEQPKPEPAPSQEGATQVESMGGLNYHTLPPDAPQRSVRELVRKLGEAVVQVRTPAGLGSGFFINEEGYLITNFHVIEGETEIHVEVYHQRNGGLDRKTYKKVRIVAMNKFLDLALLKIEDVASPEFVAAPLGDLDELSVGERVFAIGSPMGLERTVTEGIVSTKTRQVEGQLYLQTTTQINPGNSGGPLFNLRGEVVGVTNMKIMGEGLGFAIPVDAVKYFLRYRDAFAYDSSNPNNAYRYLEPPSRSDNASGSNNGETRDHASKKGS